MVILMAPDGDEHITPAVCVYHDNKNYNIEVELPGVEKEDIDFQMSENWFYLKAPKEDEFYSGCWILAHDIKPEKAKAKFENSILSISVPLEEIASEGIKITVQ